MEGFSELTIFPEPIEYRLMCRHPEMFEKYFTKDLTDKQKDALAIEQDWEKIGNDLRYAMNFFSEEYNL